MVLRVRGRMQQLTGSRDKISPCKLSLLAINDGYLADQILTGLEDQKLPAVDQLNLRYLVNKNAHFHSPIQSSPLTK